MERAGIHLLGGIWSERQRRGQAEPRRARACRRGQQADPSASGGRVAPSRRSKSASSWTSSIAPEGRGTRRLRARMDRGRCHPRTRPGRAGRAGEPAFVTRWLEERRSLLAAVRSKVLPEADVVMMNPAHPDAARVPPLVTRPFSFAECLHTPPMKARYKSEG